jgi:hypothetical protein
MVAAFHAAIADADEMVDLEARRRDPRQRLAIVLAKTHTVLPSLRKCR